MAHHSPRPSLDGSHNHASTPFFHTLTQRLRKSSNASAYSSDPSSPLSPTDPTSRTEATRAARRMVLSMVRDDWEWPPPDSSPTPTADHSNGGGRSPIPHREPLTYRLREEAQSDLEIEDYASKRRAAKSDPYKFESPEAVGTVIAERRRKRRKMQEEEMSWNEGLKTWHERRDAWTGALQQKPNSNKPTERRPSSTTKRPSYKSRLSQVFTGHKGEQPNSTDGGSTSWPVSPASPTPECSSVDSVEEPTSATRTTTNTTAEPLSPSSTSQPPSSPSSSTSTEPGPWIPIYPPILPQDNIIRERIKPSAYPTIYSKIVVQGLTPNVPIPLCHMIPALVEGWKSEGNWPPQPSAALAQDAKKGRKSSAFTKWRREHSAEDHQQNNNNNNSQDSPSHHHHHHHHFFHAGSSPVGERSGQVAAAVVTGGPKDFPNAQHEDGNGGRGHRVRRSIGMMRRMGSLLAGSMSSDGLDELGIEFREKDEEEMGRNVALNKGLVH